jgi:hypothetical protein
MTSKLKFESTHLVDTVSAETTATDEQVRAGRQSDEPLAVTAQGFVLEETSEHQRIARLAYSYWQERGCPDGSPEKDWVRAEQVVQYRKMTKQVEGETSSLPATQALAQSA